MSLAFEMCFGIPLFLGYVLSSLIVIPLVTHGITFISRFQFWTQPVWLVLHLVPFAFIAAADAALIRTVDEFRRTGRGRRTVVRSFPVWRSGVGGVFADRANRRAGRLPPLSCRRATVAGRAGWWVAYLAAVPAGS